MHIVPQEFHLKPNSVEDVEFSFTPTNIGAYHHKILVEINGLIMKPVEIIYTTY